VDESSQQIDLSYKDVNDHQRSEKIQEWKNEQKAEKWLSIALGDDIPDDQYERVIGELLSEFETVYSGFERAAIHGEEVLTELDLTDEEVDVITETARENVSVPYVTVSGYIDLECFGIEGVDAIQEALKAATGNGEVPDEVELEVTYVGAPEYRIRVQAPNYKAAETALEESVDRAQAAIEKLGVMSEFYRDRRSEEEA
jgi:translation initiation factor 2 subunit 1